MTEVVDKTHIIDKKTVRIIVAVLIIIGLGTFLFMLSNQQASRAWQAYLINFLVWSGLAQGALLFSTLMHTTKARWSHNLSGLAESFTAFFPISFILFLFLFLGKEHLFPWLHHDLHGKEVWLNLPFLFTRDFLALLVLYGLGFAYLFHALWLKLESVQPRGRIQMFLHRCWGYCMKDPRRVLARTSAFSILYMLAFAIVLSLLGFDLVMSMDPHWYSTLFGAYTFVKAFYIGLGGIIILASILCLQPGNRIQLLPSEFHDIGKLFFAFCLVWADFFYVQFVVIWYGNIPEVTSYIIERTLTAPWQSLAWTVFIVGFILPFFVLLNRKVKTMPKAMIVICIGAFVAIWLEHLLLLGPALNKDAAVLPLNLSDGLISLGFLGLMIMAVTFFLNTFANIFRFKKGEVA